MPHPVKSLLFLTLSTADVVLTWLLLRHGTGEVYESNPIANWWLTSYGWAGLVAFKAAAVMLVMVLGLVISRHRPRLGGRVLEFSCFAVAAVVVYSAALAGHQLFPSESELPPLAKESQPGELLCRPTVEFDRTRERLSLELAARVRSLEDAVRDLAATNTGRNPIFREQLTRLYPDRTYPESLAANLLKIAIMIAPGDVTEVRRLAEHLLGEFHTTFETAPPWSVDQLVAWRSLNTADALGPLSSAGTAKDYMAQAPAGNPIEGLPYSPGARILSDASRKELSLRSLSDLLPLAPPPRAVTALTPSAPRGPAGAAPGWSWRWPL